MDNQPSSEMKQYILVRQDLKMPKGKLAGQVAHASMGASSNVPIHAVEKWMEDELQTKIILKVEKQYQLENYYNLCIKMNLKPYLVTNLTNDKWKSELTCFGVGPYENKRFKDIFKELKLL